MSAELVESLDANRKTKTDILIDHDGNTAIGGKLFVGGNPASDEKNSSLLAFKRELTGLGKAVDKLSREIEKAEARCDTDRKKLAENEEKTVDLQSLIIKVERGLLGIELQETSTRQEIERADRHRQVVAAEKVQIGSEIEQLKVRLAEAASSGETAEKLRLSVAGETGTYFRRA